MKIRDFLYLDGDLLRSLTAQSSGGVTDNVLETASDSVMQGVEAKGLVGRNGSFDGTTNLTSRSESRVYHDHLFSMFETRVHAAVMTVNGLQEPELSERMKDAFLLRATGSSYIEDYGRLAVILQNFEKVSLAIAHVQEESEEHKTLVVEAENLVKALPNGPQKVIASTHLKNLKDAKKRAGLGSNKHIDGLKVMVEIFKKDALEISTMVEGAPYQFVSILDPHWLRVAPDRLRRLYGTRTNLAFTVVGQLTNFPGASVAEEDLQESDPDGSMGDALRRMVNATASVESTFLESSQGREIVLRPLAIYRETVISD